MCLTLLASQAGAATWESLPKVMGGVTYSDNYRLDRSGDARNEIEVTGLEADAQVTFRTRDPKTNFEITPRINATYFPDERREDSTDYYLDAAFSDVTQRRRFAVPFQWSKADVVRSELPGADEGELGNPVDIDSGRLLQRNRRDYLRIAPEYSYDLTQRHRLDLGAHYLRADFDNQFQGFQQDFSEWGAHAGLGFMLSERDVLTTRALVSEFDTSTTTDAYGAEVQWDRQFTQTSSVYARVGALRTSPERGASDTNLIAGAGARWMTERNTWLLDLTRSVGPVSAGTVVERNQLRVRMDRDLTQRLALRLGARVSRDEEVDPRGSYPRRDYAIGEAGLEWRWQQQWSLIGTYNYRWQEYSDEPHSGRANSLLIGIVYEPKRAN